MLLGKPPFIGGKQRGPGGKKKKPTGVWGAPRKIFFPPREKPPPQKPARGRPADCGEPPAASLRSPVCRRRWHAAEQGGWAGHRSAPCRGWNSARHPGKRAQSSCKPAEQKGLTQPVASRPLDWLQGPGQDRDQASGAWRTGRKPTSGPPLSIRLRLPVAGPSPREWGHRHGPAPVHPLSEPGSARPSRVPVILDRPDPLIGAVTSTPEPSS